MRAFFLWISFLTTPLWSFSHLVVWHPHIGADLATPSTFISTMATDDPSYNTFFLPSGQGDNDLFTITANRELRVGSSSLSEGSYSVIIRASGGGGVYQQDCTVTVVAGSALPQIRSEQSTTLALDQNGVLYGWGSGWGGRLAQGDEVDSNLPVIIPAASYGNEEVIQIVHKVWSTHLVTRSGAVYGFGWNDLWELGVGSTDRYLVPTIVQGDLLGKRIVRAGGVYGGTTFLEDNGQLYSTGQEIYLGRGTGVGNSMYPALITSTLPGSSLGPLEGRLVIDIAWSRSAIYLLTADGRLYGFGHNHNDQMAFGNTSSYDRPTFVRSGVKKVFSSSARTSYVLTDSDRLEVSGEAHVGETGLGNTNQTTQYEEVDFGGNTLHKFDGGSASVLVILSDFSLYGFGRNDYRQVARTAGNKLSPVLETTSFNGIIRQAVVGREQAMVLTSSGKVYGVGRNNEGQIGNGGFSDLTNYTELNLINLGTVPDLDFTTLPGQTSVVEVTISSFQLTWNSYNLEELLQEL